MRLESAEYDQQLRPSIACKMVLSRKPPRTQPADPSRLAARSHLRDKAKPKVSLLILGGSKGPSEERRLLLRSHQEEGNKPQTTSALAEVLTQCPDRTVRTAAG